MCRYAPSVDQHHELDHDLQLHNFDVHLHLYDHNHLDNHHNHDPPQH